MSNLHKEIAQELINAPYVSYVQYFETIESTNVYCRMLLADCPDPLDWSGFLALAGEQTKGRGRGDHEWVSPSGGIYFSLVLDRLFPSGFSLLCGLSVSEVIEKHTNTANVNVKWPNDILLDERKLCGILIQTIREMSIIGIGVNTFRSTYSPFETAAVVELPGMTERVTLVRDILFAIRDWTDKMDRFGFDVIKNALMPKLAYLGETVVIKNGDLIQSGIFEGIGEQGEAILRIGERSLKFHSGSLLPSGRL